MGTSVSLVGGGLTIAGGILTVATAGVATPVLIAGGHSKYLFSHCLLASDVTFLTQVFWVCGNVICVWPIIERLSRNILMADVNILSEMIVPGKFKL